MARDAGHIAAHLERINGIGHARLGVGHHDVRVGDVARVGYFDLVEDHVAQLVGFLRRVQLRLLALNAQHGLFHVESDVHFFDFILGVRRRARVRSRRRYGQRPGSLARRRRGRSAAANRSVVLNGALQHIALRHLVGSEELFGLTRREAGDCLAQSRQAVLYHQVGVGDVAGVLNRDLVPDHVVQFVGLLLRVAVVILVQHTQRGLRLLILGLHRHSQRRVGRLEAHIFIGERGRHRVHEFAPDDIRLSDRVGRGGRTDFTGRNIRELALLELNIRNLREGDRLRRVVDVLHRDGEGHHLADVVSAIFMCLGHDQARISTNVQNRQQAAYILDDVVPLFLIAIRSNRVRTNVFACRTRQFERHSVIV